MKIIYGDFESYFEPKTYSLKGGEGLTPYEYILDHRWETIGCGIAYSEGTPFFLPGDEVAKLLREYPRPWAFASYNSLFDSSILAYRYGIHPDMHIDALGLVRALLMHKLRDGRASLGKVAEFLNLPHKDEDALQPYWRSADYERDPVKWERLKSYCCQDTDSMRQIVKLLAPSFPRRELWIMSIVINMATRPNFYSDIIRLSEHLSSVVASKDQLLQRVGMTKGELLSNDQFVHALTKLGIDPPMKWSEAQQKYVYACAKTDLNYLLEDENPDVQALIAARTGVKSTLEEARTSRFIRLNQSSMQAFKQPWMPIALRYGAAHTHRLGGEWKVNMQNLPARKNTKLRDSLIAPPEHVVLAVDAAQIECRLTAWLAGEMELLEQFASGSDVYSWFGSDLFKVAVTKNTHPIERFVAKGIVLGLGFQMGASKLLWTLTAQAAEYGFDIEFTLGQCEVWVNYYRSKFKRIKNLWYATDNVLKQMTYPNPASFQMGPSYTEGTDLVLPTGLRLYYDNLREENHKKVFDWGRERREIYGGKFTENHVQALDFAHVMDVAYRIEQRCKIARIYDEHFGPRLAHQVHDELIYVPHKSQVATLGVIAYEEMKTPSWWGTGLPLEAELKIGPSYGELKEVKLKDLK